MSYLAGKFIWFEHASPDPAKARAFYEPLFGWHVEQMPMGEQAYHMVLNGADGIGGLTRAQPGQPAAWVSYISVTDVDQRYRAALDEGAAPVMPPTDFAPVGRGASIVDPTGAAVSLWKSAQNDRPDAERVPIGAWYWNELMTQDARKALAFYEKVFGYTHEDMQIEGMAAPYRILHAAGKPRGGIFQAPDPAIQPMWLPYVHVADCDATAARATQLGARICMPPTDIPGVGRFASVSDPQGAQIAFIKGQPAS